MNADGRPGIDIGADLGARMPAVLWIALGVLIAGAVFLAGGGLLIAGAIRARRASQATPGVSRKEGAIMQPIKEAASEFLANKRVAVTGVSRTPKTHGSNNVYRRLRERGYDVFAVNPNADQVEGDRSYPDLKSIPGGVEAVVIGTRPELAEDTMQECAELGIKHVWMHRGPGAGSVSAAATDYGRQHGITVIDGGCPLMFEPTADFGHKIMRFVYAGKVPKQV
jgi:predicted CoA-binding protein